MSYGPPPPSTPEEEARIAEIEDLIKADPQLTHRIRWGCIDLHDESKHNRRCLRAVNSVNAVRAGH